MTYRKATVTKEVEQIVEINCDECGQSIPLVFPDRGNRQGKNMLTILFMGSYGEFIDGKAKAEICHACATKLQAAFPALAKIIEQAEFQG